MTRSTSPDPRGRAPAVLTAIAVLVHSNVFVSIAAASVAVSTMLLVGYPLRPGPVCIVFAVTMFVYSLNRITDVEEDERNVPQRAAFTRRYGRALLVLSVCAYAVAVAVALARGLPRVEFMALPLVVGALYSLFRVKRLFLVKNLLVGASWGVIPLGVCVYFGGDWTVEVAFLAGYVFVMLAVAAVVFDVKDIDGDQKRGIRTVPTEFGPRATRAVAGVVTVAAAAVVVGLVVVGVLPGRYLVLVAFDAYVLGYTVVATPDRGPLFYGFVADGEHLFLALVLLGVEWL
ncbi:UbiA family prenyltransferase [Halomicrobium salinisoli]|uniref:UbiA family prenyltransferase n=1 Tax=Halomicrobium salinisoli TaxID=2878391 RepID=UPI001CF0779B|nr:UbiA family prenyltransferase [Halomicrobium salinisoli]